MPPPLRQINLFRLEQEARAFRKMIEVMLQEAFYSRVRQDILVIHLRFEDILQPFLKRERQREMVDVVVSENRYAENPLPVLRNSVVLRIENLPVVRVSVTFKLVQPLVEKADELLADKSLYILQKKILRLLFDDGLAAFPKKG